MNMKAVTMRSRIFAFLLVSSMSILNFASLVPSLGIHRPRPSFSFSAYVFSGPVLNRGKLADNVRICRLKKPGPCVENDG